MGNAHRGGALNTLDLDFNDKEKMRIIIEKIRRCKYAKAVYMRESASTNGFHIKIYCSIVCDICRIVFDDPRRMFFENVNEGKRRNCLWDEKAYYKAKTVVRLRSGEWRRIK
jgi:DNA-binding Lrp family transcriptional regulator